MYYLNITLSSFKSYCPGHIKDSLKPLTSIIFLYINFTIDADLLQNRSDTQIPIHSNWLFPTMMKNYSSLHWLGFFLLMTLFTSSMWVSIIILVLYLLSFSPTMHVWFLSTYKPSSLPTQWWNIQVSTSVLSYFSFT